MIVLLRNTLVNQEPDFNQLPAQRRVINDFVFIILVDFGIRFIGDLFVSFIVCVVYLIPFAIFGSIKLPIRSSTSGSSSLYPN